MQCVVNVTAYDAAQITKTGPHTELSIYDCSGQYDVYCINHALHSVGHFKLIVHCVLHFKDIVHPVLPTAHGKQC